MTTTRRILDDIDYLVPLISYLGANPYWWARSAPSLGEELGLEVDRVQAIFERYPMIFRKSRYIEESGAYSYALQMRYAQRRDGDTDQPPQVSHFPVLSEAQLLSLIEFLVKLSSVETTLHTSRRTAAISVVAAVISAITAIIVALVKV